MACRDAGVGIGPADNWGRCAGALLPREGLLDRTRHGAGAFLLHLDKTNPSAGAWERGAPALGPFLSTGAFQWIEPPALGPLLSTGLMPAQENRWLRRRVVLPAALPVALLLVVGQRLGGVLGLGLGNCNGTKQPVYGGKYLLNGLA